MVCKSPFQESTALTFDERINLLNRLGATQVAREMLAIRTEACAICNKNECLRISDHFSSHF